MQQTGYLGLRPDAELTNIVRKQGRTLMIEMNSGASFAAGMNFPIAAVQVPTKRRRSTRRPERAGGLMI